MRFYLFVRSQYLLFPLNRSCRLRSEVVENAVDACDLGGDTGGDLVKDRVGDLLDGGGHGILGVYGADDSGPSLISAFVLDTNALHVGNNNKVLPHLFCKTVLVELVAENCVCLAKSRKPVTCDSAKASYAKTGTGEGLTVTVLVGLLFSLLFYLFFTSRWAKRFSEKTSEFYILTAIFLFSFVLRVFLSSRSEGHITDLNCFKAWAVNLQTYGLSGFYESGIFADYMPGYYYILYIIGYIYNIFGFTYESVAFRILVEFVPILCDLALAFFAYRIIRKSQNKRIASLCAIFLLFIPFSFTDSVIWGQIDSVFTLALLGSLYLLKTDKKVFSCLLWAVSLMIKPQALLVAPVIAIVFLKDLFTRGSFKKTLLDAIISLVVIAASVLLLSLPMKGSQPLLYIVDRMLNTTGQYAYGTVNAFNFFGLLGGNFVVDTTPVLFGLTYRTLGWLLIILSTALTGFLYFRKGTKKDIFLYSGLYLLLIYVFAHNMHERYVYPALVLLAVSAFERDSREIFFPTAVLGGSDTWWNWDIRKSPF